MKLFNWIIEKITDYPKIFRELYIFITYLSQINDEKKKVKFRRLKLRADWIGRIYTVINLEEAEAKWEEVEKRNLLLDKLKEVNFYLTSLNLQEILTPNIRPIASFEQIEEEKEIIKNYEYAYLITYTYIFEYFNLWFIVKHIFIGVVSYYIWHNYSSNIMVFINKIIEFISSHLSQL